MTATGIGNVSGLAVGVGVSLGFAAGTGTGVSLFEVVITGSDTLVVLSLGSVVIGGVSTFFSAGIEVTSCLSVTFVACSLGDECVTVVSALELDVCSEL